jgi:hypothetical protein
VGVAPGDGPFERQRPGGRRHPVGGVDVVLDDDRDPVQRTARPLRLALLVERAGDRQRLGVGLADRPQVRPLAIDLVDPRQVQLDELPRRVAALGHPVLQLGDGRFGEGKR